MRLNIRRTASGKFKSIVMYVASFALVLGLVGFAVPRFFNQIAHADGSPILTLTANPISKIINKSVLVTAAAVDTAIIGLTPIKITLTNTGTVNSNPVRLVPIGDESEHIQFWTLETLSGTHNWYNINVSFWSGAQSFFFPPAYSPMITDVYAISDKAGTYPWTINLVDATNPSTVVAHTGGTVTVVDVILDAAKATAKANVETALATYTLTDYTTDNWIALNLFHTNGDTAIDAATDLAGVTLAQDAATFGMANVAKDLANAKITAYGVLNNALGTYLVDSYTADNWTALNGFKTTGDTNIDAVTTLAGVTSAQTTATEGMAGVEQTAAIPTSIQLALPVALPPTSPSPNPIVADNTIQTTPSNNQDAKAVLGDTTKKDNNGSLDKVAALAATDSGWSIFGLMWYWWALIAAAIAAAWWVISAAIRRRGQGLQ